MTGAPQQVQRPIRDVTQDPEPRPIGVLVQDGIPAALYDGADYATMHNPTRRPTNQFIPFRYVDEARIKVEPYTGEYRDFDWLLRGNASFMLGEKIGMLTYRIADGLLKGVPGRIFFRESPDTLEVVYRGEDLQEPQSILRRLEEDIRFDTEGLRVTLAQDGNAAEVVIALPKQPITKLAEMIRRRERRIEELCGKLELVCREMEAGKPEADLFIAVVPHVQAALRNTTRSSHVGSDTLQVIQAFEGAPLSAARELAHIILDDALMLDPETRRYREGAGAGICSNYLLDRAEFDRKMILALAPVIGRHRLGEFADQLLLTAGEFLLAHWESEIWEGQDDRGRKYTFEHYSEEPLRAFALALGRVAHDDLRTANKLIELVSSGSQNDWWHKRLAILTLRSSGINDPAAEAALKEAEAFSTSFASSLTPLFPNERFRADRLRRFFAGDNTASGETVATGERGYSHSYSICRTVDGALYRDQNWDWVLETMGKFVSDLEADRAEKRDRPRSIEEREADLMSAIERGYARAGMYPVNALEPQLIAFGRIAGNVPLHLAKGTVKIIGSPSSVIYGEHQNDVRAGALGALSARLFQIHSGKLSGMY